jgi:hypothetical protein
VSDVLVPAVHAILIGIGATALMDLFAMLRRRLFGVASIDDALVGRWIGHLAKGRFRHRSIAAAAPVDGERMIGRMTHYLTGVAFASVLLATWGIGWARHPTIVPALVVGMISVAAPFLLMQPGMGAGIAARLTRNPWAARARSLAMHAVFGLGLYISAWVLHECGAN